MVLFTWYKENKLKHLFLLRKRRSSQYSYFPSSAKESSKPFCNGAFQDRKKTHCSVCDQLWSMKDKRRCLRTTARSVLVNCFSPLFSDLSRNKKDINPQMLLEHLHETCYYNHCNLENKQTRNFTVILKVTDTGKSTHWHTHRSKELDSLNLKHDLSSIKLQTRL